MDKNPTDVPTVPQASAPESSSCSEGEADPTPVDPNVAGLYRELEKKRTELQGAEKALRLLLSLRNQMIGATTVMTRCSQDEQARFRSLTHNIPIPINTGFPLVASVILEAAKLPAPPPIVIKAASASRSPYAACSSSPSCSSSLHDEPHHNSSPPSVEPANSPPDEPTAISQARDVDPPADSIGPAHGVDGTSSPGDGTADHQVYTPHADPPPQVGEPQAHDETDIIPIVAADGEPHAEAVVREPKPSSPPASPSASPSHSPLPSIRPASAPPPSSTLPSSVPLSSPPPSLPTFTSSSQISPRPPPFPTSLPPAAPPPLSSSPVLSRLPRPPVPPSAGSEADALGKSEGKRAQLPLLSMTYQSGQLVTAGMPSSPSSALPPLVPPRRLQKLVGSLSFGDLARGDMSPRLAASQCSFLAAPPAPTPR